MVEVNIHWADRLWVIFILQLDGVEIQALAVWLAELCQIREAMAHAPAGQFLILPPSVPTLRKSYHLEQ